MPMATSTARERMRFPQQRHATTVAVAAACEHLLQLGRSQKVDIWGWGPVPGSLLVADQGQVTSGAEGNADREVPAERRGRFRRALLLSSTPRRKRTGGRDLRMRTAS